MTKIKNRFNKKSILTVHDNLLADLYYLSLDIFYQDVYGVKYFDPDIAYKEIDGVDYLVNYSIGREYEIGLRVMIPSNLLVYNGISKKYSELPIDKQESIFNELKDRLYFSNAEILLTNILLDNFLHNNKTLDISFDEIESNYRNKSSKSGINDFTCKKYVETINKLTDKEVYIITFNNFRDVKYGVNNRDFSQQLLMIYEFYHGSGNNIIFNYTLGEFGNILKNSKRYDDNLNPIMYTYNFNQLIKHTIAYYIGQTIFINNNKYKKLSDRKMKINIDDLMFKVCYESRNMKCQGHTIYGVLNEFKSQPNKNRTYRMIVKYVLELLGDFKKNNTIYDYSFTYENKYRNMYNEHFDDQEYEGPEIIGNDFIFKDINQDFNIGIIVYLTKESYDSDFDEELYYLE